MIQNKTFGSRLFTVINTVLLILMGLLCLLPVLHVFALSLSSSNAVSAGSVLFWPVQFTLSSYEFAMKDPQFLRSFGISILRVLVGVLVNVVMTVITAYPLSRNGKRLHGRNLYVGYFFLTMLIGGGMIPTYLVVARTGLLDSLWALIIPGALPVYYMIIMMNFMRGIPPELEESAMIDGARPLQILFRVWLPVLKPSVATVTLFCIVGHWNDWFGGLLYMNKTSNYPLQTYLQSLLTNFDALLKQNSLNYVELIKRMNARTGRAAQVFLAAIPLLVIYPFLQKYFTKGLTLGSVKG